MDTRQISPGSIVVGYDGSTHADRALAWAADQADLEHRELVVLHAAREDDVRTAIVLGAAVMPVSHTRLLGHARGVADRGAVAARTRHPGLTVRSLPQVGDPRPDLVSLSRAASMVVIGSRGRGAIASSLLGSVSAYLARHTECPLAVCRPGNPGLVHDGVVVATDGTPTSRPVLEQAFRQASLRGLPLTIVHCVDGEETLEAERRALAESVAGFGEKFPDVSVDQQLGNGPVPGALLRDRPWSVVVVGRHPLDSVSRRLSHVTATDVIEHADTTVLVVPQERD